MTRTADSPPGREFVTANAKQTRAIGERLGRLSRPGDWFGLTGELGAGKTCLVQGFSKGAGVARSVPVTSPTFTILQTYPGRVSIHHLDLYRISDYGELTEIGYEELSEGDGVCLVEWCDQIPESRPLDGLVIRIELLSESSRQLRMTALGPRGQELLKALDSDPQHESR